MVRYRSSARTAVMPRRNFNYSSHPENDFPWEFYLAKSRLAAARRCVRSNKDADAAAAHPLAAAGVAG